MKFNYVFRLIRISTQQTTITEARIVIKSDKDIDKYNKKELENLLFEHGYNKMDWQRFSLLYKDVIE
ncbi:hypothetical protein [Klebsiella pneumoniae]|uniref:hypothetical protein n=1 Tax=Klebsiella pneumoniae TaxID=573 RepID=UPI002B460386|nr:hypothetical protein [Klebsiella pneumoniae]MEB2901882.1 hypothetical protein [Klebsiella pneumoniae]